MKKLTRLASIGISALMIASTLSLSSIAATESVSGSSKVVTEQLKVNGKDTGATLTQAILDAGSVYTSGNTQGLLNIVEANPKDNNLSFEVLNGGTYTYNVGTMGNESVKYNANHKGETVIAAMNTDPWFLHHKDYTGDGKSDVGTDTPVKHVSAFRGVMIIDGELWATPQIADEGNMSCGTEAATVATTQAAFAYLTNGNVFIGSPEFKMDIKNTTTNSGSYSAHGLNRLPAPNSTIIYNYRGGSESYAYSDAYEIYVRCDSAASFKVGKELSGTVTHIFASGDTAERPAIDENTVVISSRGSQIRFIKNSYNVGDTISITPKVKNDIQNNANKGLWSQVESATGGFWTVCMNGVRKDNREGNTSQYPCPVVGIKADGTVVMITSTATADGTRSAITQGKIYDLVIELGCKDALMFDGGGSCQMVTLENGEYVRRSSASDGKNQVRSVVNGLALVYHGDAGTTVKNSETNGINFLDGTGLADTGSGEGQTTALEGDPAYGYAYAGTVESICGVGPDGTENTKYENVYGYRDPDYDAGWTTEQKLASRTPATVDGSNIKLIDDKILSISGWAFANGSQKRIVWSVDQKTWYDTENGSFSDAPNEVQKLVTNNKWIKVLSAEHAVFEGAEADLSEYAGQTVNIYFGVTPGTDDRACHFLTIENVAVPEKKVETPSTGEEETSDDVTSEVTTEEITETTAPESTIAESEITSNENVTENKEESKGCGSSVAVSASLISIAALGIVISKKKKRR